MDDDAIVPLLFNLLLQNDFTTICAIMGGDGSFCGEEEMAHYLVAAAQLMTQPVPRPRQGGTRISVASLVHMGNLESLWHFR
jgi:hypothetical protein